MKYILASSEYGGKEENLVLARKYCKYVLSSGDFNCTAPHLLYPQFLDEGVKAERAFGLRLVLDLIESRVDEVWVFVRNGRISDGMEKEIRCAIRHQKPRVYLDATDLGNIIKLDHVTDL
jgi:hypothetical protein